MKILFLHPYGKLGDLNHRLQRQIELMSLQCAVRVESIKSTNLGFSNDEIKRIEDIIKEWKPHLLYVNGFFYERIVRDFDIPVIYDMGSFFSRNILMKQYGYDVKEMLEIPDKELVWKLENSRMGDYYRKEKSILEQVKAIITWGSNEDILMKKIFGKGVAGKIKEIPMMFYELPEVIPFEKKENKIISIAVRGEEKNIGFLNKVSKEIDIKVIDSFIERDKLLNLINKSKVVFCPYKAGGIGIVLEALSLSCNVVTMDYYSFNKYINNDLIANRKNVVDKLKLAQERYFLVKEELSKEKEQLSKIMDLCQSLILDVDQK